MYRPEIPTLILLIFSLGIFFTSIQHACGQEVQQTTQVPSASTEGDENYTTPVININSTVEPSGFNFSAVRGTKRPLTAEEQEMADKARAHIAEVVRKNLIRLFAVIAATNQRDRGSRQFEDEEDEDEGTSFNPNTLPQVAQLLGSIFAGNLNLTNIVDRAFFLVPETLRTQVGGIFQLLSGQTTTTTAAPEAATLKVIRTRPTAAITEESRIVPTTELAPDVVASFVISSPTRNKTKYKVRRKLPSTTTSPIVIENEEYEIISDEELRRLEDNIVASARQQLLHQRQQSPQPQHSSEPELEPLPVVKIEPAVAPTQPPIQSQPEGQEFMNQLRQVFANTNMTSVIRALPDIFNGARQAYVLLERLGQLDDIPILGDLLGGDDDDDEE